MSDKPTYEELEQRVKELQKTELELRKSEQRYQDLFENAPLMVHSIDHDGKIGMVSEYWLRHLGYNRDEVLGKDSVSFLTEDSQKKAKEIYLPKFFKNGKIFNVPYEMIKKNGEVVNVLLSASSERDNDGNVVKSFAVCTDITKHTNTDMKLSQSHERYKALFDDSPVPIWEEDFTEIIYYLGELRSNGIVNFRKFFDRNQDAVFECAQKIKVLDVNKAAIKLHEANNKQNLLGNLEKIFTEKSMEGFKEELIQLAEGKTQICIEGEVKTLSGERKNIYLQLNLNKTVSNRSIALLTTIDVTEIKTVQEALNRSIKMMSSLLNNSPVPAFLKDHQGKYLFVNRNYAERVGLSQEEVVGLTDYEIVAEPETAGRFQSNDDLVFENKEVMSEESTITVASGVYSFITLKFPVFNDKGEVYAVGGVAFDITERKQAEEALRESEERLSSIYNITGDIIFMLDVKGEGEYNFNTVNPAFLSATGLKAESVIGKNVKEVIPDSSLELVLNKYAQAIEKKTTIRWEESSEYPTGKRTALVTIDPIFSVDGICKKLVGIVHDITDRKNMEQKLVQSQKMESIGQLAGGIAHDFNNILYPIIGFTQLSQNDLPNEHPIQENLKDILDGAMRARDLVKRILLFSRQKEHQLEPTLLQPIIKESYKLLRSSIPVNIDLTLDLYDGEDYVLCDSTEIHEIILNLCTNAFHAILEDKGKIIISLKEQKPNPELNLSPGGYLCLSVMDNGIGVPEKIRDKIFEPYVTTKDVGKGSGLGLSVVFGIVKSYKGGINIESNSLEWTKFNIFLPISKEKPAEKIFRDKEILKSEGHERILFVDDEGSIVKLVTRSLERCGYHVTASKDSQKAFELFKSNPDAFDLVITDMAMPGLVGSELSKKILEIQPDIPIIICSGYSERLEKIKTKDLNISAYLDKPLSLEELIKNVKKILTNS